MHNFFPAVSGRAHRAHPQTKFLSNQNALSVCVYQGISILLAAFTYCVNYNDEVESQRKNESAKILFLC